MCPQLLQSGHSFQFHEGPIKTGGGKFDFAVREQFQFHEGPIKTTFLNAASLAQNGFNSMKVRLKHNLRNDRFNQDAVSIP